MRNNTYYFILSGGNEELAQAELKALLETYGFNSDIECYTMVCLVECSREQGFKVISRAGYIKELGVVIGYDDLGKPSYDYVRELDGYRFDWVKPFNPYSMIDEILVHTYIETLCQKLGVVDRYYGKNYLHVLFSEYGVIVGYPLARQDTSKLRIRSPGKRPFFRSIASPPTLSRILVNLARVREGDTILDPFCGTGSILIEAGFMGIHGIGVDIDWELVHGSMKNIEYYSLWNQIIVLGDTRELVYVDIDGIATDPPYGRAASTHGEDIRVLYREFLERAYESVKHGGYIVFMAPLNMEEYIDEVLCNLGLIIRGKHYMYVHGSLTRIIYEVFKP